MDAFIQAWTIIDKLYDLFNNLEYVNKQQKNIFRVKLLHYRGPDLVLSDESIIRNKDLVLKIHLHNCLLQKEMSAMSNEVKRAFYVHQRVQQSLPDLARFVWDHPKRESIKGLVGITLLTRGVKNLGFEVKEIENDLYRLAKQMYLVPMFLLCHSHYSALSSKKKGSLTPKFLVMSKETLFSQYSKRGTYVPGPEPLIENSNHLL